MSRLFDTVVIVDWSSRGMPSRRAPSADAIWIGTAGGAESEPRYVRTRAEAMAWLADFLATERGAGRRVLAGFDFPFGYPGGFAGALTGCPSGLAVWDHLAARLTDGPANANDRFAVAAAINAAFPGPGPFWGNGLKLDLSALARKKHAFGQGLHEFRIVERMPYARGAKSCWQLSGAGSVGGQVLTGLPALARLRRDPRLAGIAVWPFETGLAAPDAPLVLAEVYPSLLAAEIAADRRALYLDADQVRVTAHAFAALDAGGGLAPLFAGAADLGPAERALVATEEAWILGAGHATSLRAAAAALPFPAPAL